MYAAEVARADGCGQAAERADGCGAQVQGGVEGKETRAFYLTRGAGGWYNLCEYF